MKRILVLLIAILMLLLPNIGLTFQNEPEGFRGLKWGDPPTEGMEYFGTFGGCRAYTLPDDKMLMGNAELYMIVYTFHGKPERFMAVGLYFRKEENFDLLKMICDGKFGEATEKSFLGSMFTWQGQKAVIMLKYDTIEEKGYLAIDSFQISMEKVKTDKQKETEEAEKDW